MQANRGKDTGPEMAVRRLVHRLGYRYRLHGRKLPGKPDLVFGPRRKVIFVHGCFWHHHSDPGCPIAHVPSSRREYWQAKFERNKARDERQLNALAAEGWMALILWECEVMSAVSAALADRIKAFLKS